MENISITVPMEHGALKRAAELFVGLAADVALDKAEVTAKRPAEEVTAPELDGFDPVPAVAPEPEAAEVFAQPTVTPTPENTLEPLTDMTPAPTAGVEVDINGIPWDVRIHASTKTKTVDGAWKNKRGVDRDLVLQVTNELKGVMTAQTPAPSPEPVTEATPAPSASISTFPELMTAITASSLEPAIVTGAVQAVGLQSLPLLAARTDLIPQVVERLGL